MKNSLSDLNNVLFEQLERLNDDDIMKKTQKAAAERERAKSIGAIAKQIIDGAKVQLDAIRLREEWHMQNSDFTDALVPKRTQYLEAKK